MTAMDGISGRGCLSHKAAPVLLEVATRCAMEQQEPNPASAKEKAEGSRDHVAPDAKRRADMATGEPTTNKSDTPPELDGKNDSGVEPEIHGHELPGE